MGYPYEFAIFAVDDLTAKNVFKAVDFECMFHGKCSYITSYSPYICHGKLQAYCAP